MRRDDVYLLDILIAARKALKFTAGIGRDEFEQNELVQNAVLHPLEIIGEAANLISDDFREAHSEIPWFKMIGMRNRLIHEYFRVDYGVVWDTIQNDLPNLIEQIERFVPPLEED
jgi:uncharacterized protein with HEPN domain